MKMLPIGSVVLLKNASKKIMVIGLYPCDKTNDKCYDYLACTFPEGVVSSQKYLGFNHEQIEKIYHYGLKDVEQTFLNKGLELLKDEK